MKDKIEAGEPAIGFSLDCKINERRAIVIQSYLPIETPASEINTLLDKLFISADRQELRYRLKDLRLLLEKHEQELPLHKRDLEKFEEDTLADHASSGRRSAFEWKGTLKASRDNKLQNIEMTHKYIERTKKAIAEAEAELKE